MARIKMIGRITKIKKQKVYVSVSYSKKKVKVYRKIKLDLRKVFEVGDLVCVKGDSYVNIFRQNCIISDGIKKLGKDVGKTYWPE